MTIAPWWKLGREKKVMRQKGEIDKTDQHCMASNGQVRPLGTVAGHIDMFMHHK
jgi:hypothetical protein